MSGVDLQLGRRRGRRALLRRLTVAVLIATTGCQELPRYHVAPSAAVSAAVEMPTQINVIDARPAWERHYYQGGNNGFWLGNRITCIPAEQIEPSPWEMLKREIAARFAAAPCQPPRMDLTIVSFRTVLCLNDGNDLINEEWTSADVRRRLRDSDEERTLQYCKLKWADNPEKHLYPEKKDEVDDTWILAVAALGAFAAVATVGYSTSYLCDGTRRLGHALHLRPGKAGPPRAFAGRNYRRGVTFEILFDAQITYASGEAATTRVDHTFFIPDSDDSPDRIGHAIAVGLSDAADKLMLQAFHFPTPQETQPPLVSLPPIHNIPTASLATPADLGVTGEIERLQRSEEERLSRISRGQPLR